jgi:hypothetical protein
MSDLASSRFCARFLTLLVALWMLWWTLRHYQHIEKGIYLIGIAYHLSYFCHGLAFVLLIVTACNRRLDGSHPACFKELWAYGGGMTGPVAGDWPEVQSSTFSVEPRMISCSLLLVMVNEATFKLLLNDP